MGCGPVGRLGAVFLPPVVVVSRKLGIVARRLGRPDLAIDELVDLPVVMAVLPGDVVRVMGGLNGALYSVGPALVVVRAVLVLNGRVVLEEVVPLPPRCSCLSSAAPGRELLPLVTLLSLCAFAVRLTCAAPVLC